MTKKKFRFYSILPLQGHEGHKTHRETVYSIIRRGKKMPVEGKNGVIKFSYEFHLNKVDSYGFKTRFYSLLYFWGFFFS